MVFLRKKNADSLGLTEFIPKKSEFPELRIINKIGDNFHAALTAFSGYYPQSIPKEFKYFRIIRKNSYENLLHKKRIFDLFKTELKKAENSPYLKVWNEADSYWKQTVYVTGSKVESLEFSIGRGSRWPVADITIDVSRKGEEISFGVGYEKDKKYFSEENAKDAAIALLKQINDYITEKKKGND